MNAEDRARCIAYIEEVADDLYYDPPLCAACGFDAFPSFNEKVSDEFAICDQCHARALAVEAST